MSEDAIAKFKEAQREGWKHFAPLEALTTPAAARLVKFAKVGAGDEVLDVACGTGVVAITAACLYPGPWFHVFPAPNRALGGMAHLVVARSTQR